MEVLIPGHRYKLDHLDDTKKSIIQFVNREPGWEHGGPTTQEFIRALIDRTLYCNHCLPSELNFQAVYHLRMALALHEARHLIRMTEKGDPIECAEVGEDQHLKHLYHYPQVARPYYAESMDDYETATGGPNPGTPCYQNEEKS